KSSDIAVDTSCTYMVVVIHTGGSSMRRSLLCTIKRRCAVLLALAWVAMPSFAFAAEHDAARTTRAARPSASVRRGRIDRRSAPGADRRKEGDRAVQEGRLSDARNHFVHAAVAASYAADFGEGREQPHLGGRLFMVAGHDRMASAAAEARAGDT